MRTFTHSNINVSAIKNGEILSGKFSINISVTMLHKTTHLYLSRIVHRYSLPKYF
jgi:hypothetical protein